MKKFSLIVLFYCITFHVQAQLQVKTNRKGKCGYCKMGDNEYVIKPIYNYCGEVVNNTIIVSKYDRFKGPFYGMIDTLGNTLIDFDYGGLEYVGKMVKRRMMYETVLYNLEGKRIFEKSLLKFGKKFKDNTMYICSDGHLYGLVSEEGVPVVPLAYDSIFQTNNYKFYFFKHNGLFGIMNDNGAIIHEPTLDKVNRIESDSIMVKKNGAWYIWQSGDSTYISGKMSNPLPDILPCYDCTSCLEKGLNPSAIDHCSNSNMLQFVYKNLKYPLEARKNHIEGTCKVQFTVNLDGSTSDFVVTQSLGYGIDEASIDVAKKLHFDRAAVFDGDFMASTYTLPVKFKMEH